MAGHEKGAGGAFVAWLARKKNYFSLARRASRRWEPETRTRNESAPSQWAPWGRSAHKKKYLTNGRNEAAREPGAGGPTTLDGATLRADALPRYAGRISRAVGFAVKMWCGGAGKSVRELQGETKPIQNGPVTILDTTPGVSENLNLHKCLKDWCPGGDSNPKPID